MIFILPTCSKNRSA